MGQVFLARDLAYTGRLVALKMLLPEYLDSTSEFMREFVLQQRLRHPCIPRVYDFGFGAHAMGEVPYFAMDYVRGAPLARAVEQLDRRERAWPWVIETLRALDHLHGLGYLHRDLKPSNILVSQDGTGSSHATLIDYGIAIEMSATPEELFIGTPEYSAPELMAGDPFDVRQDLYAIGLLIYEIVSGRRPWPQEDPSALWEVRTHGSYRKLTADQCSPALAGLVDDLLMANIERRPSSAAVVIERLAAAVGLEAEIETRQAFRLRLDSHPMVEPAWLERAAREWHAGARAAVDEDRPRPAIFTIETPAGQDGDRYLCELTDRGAVGGARVVRVRLARRPYAPLEAIEPALAVFRRLREQRLRGRHPTQLRGLAGAATMLTRLHGQTIISIDGLQRADVLTLELLTTVFTGAANQNLRVIATYDPDEEPAAPDAFEALMAAEFTHRERAEAPELADVVGWFDEVLGRGVVAPDRAAILFGRSRRRPAHLRALIAEEFNEGRIRRTASGYLLASTFATGGDGARPEVEASIEDVLSCLKQPLPEQVVLSYLGADVDYVPYLLQDGLLVRHQSGWIGLGEAVDLGGTTRRLGAGERHLLHRRLAVAVADAEPFDGQADACAREWLRSDRPIQATPWLVAAANAAADRRDAAAACAHLDRARNLVEAHAASAPGATLFEFRLQVQRTALRLARQSADFDAWERASSELFQLGVQQGHVRTMRAGLDAMMELSVERREWAALMEHAEARRALPADGGDAEGEGVYQWAVAEEAWARGAVDRALAALDRGLESQPGVGSELKLLALRAQILVATQHVALAGPALVALRAKAVRVGGVAERALGEILAAQNERERGRPAEALEIMRRLTTEVGDVHHRRVSGLIELEFARCHAELGWLSTALDHADRARALAERDRDPETAMLARVVEARSVSVLGYPSDALELLDDVREDLHPSPSKLLDLEIAYTALEISVSSGVGRGHEDDVDRARRFAVDATRHQVRAAAVRGWALAARAALECGRPEDAVDFAEGALDLSARWRDVGLPRHYLLFILARARHRLRQFHEADEILREAREDLHETARRISDAGTRRAWLQRPMNAWVSSGELAQPEPLSRRSAKVRLTRDEITRS